MSNGEQVTYFAETDFRNNRTKFGIKNKDRSRHVYVIGKTGMGKSTLLENMAAQDILNGEGMCFMDPHGSAIDTLLEYVPSHRVRDIVYFAPFDTDYPISFNVLEAVEPDRRHLVVAGLMASFKKIWVDAWSARMEYILSNTLLALLEYPNATLLGVNRMLAEKDYRNDVIKHVTDASVRSFWIDEYNKWDPRYAREAGAAIQNKIGQFTANPLIRNIIGQQHSSIDFRKIMDEKKILLVNLSKGLIGESNGNLLGGMLITKLFLGALSRADVGATRLNQLPDFFFFVDEFQNFANESFADILSEARKYKLNLTVAHQYVDQMEESVASAIFGNVGTMITFRIGANDAEIFEKQFAPTFTSEDLVNLGKFQIYLSLMIDGIGSRPFSARTIAPVERPPVSMRAEIIQSSREQFARPRKEVEMSITEWYEPVNKPEKRTFRNDDGSMPKANTNATPSISPKKIEKQSFIIPKGERDNGSSPLKKVAKELDEKEAELEMKKIVSPKLNSLLDKMGGGEEKKILPEVVENIRKHDVTSEPLKKTGNVQTSETKIPESVTQRAASVNKQQPATSDRGAKVDTMSSLQEVLKKAMGGKRTVQKQVRKQPNQSGPTIQQPKQSNHDTTQQHKQDTSTISSPQTNTEQKKEVPEDVLRGIFS
ncbi:type IV secretion system DNA-binding domain-containing protein [Patescibacteria group bacterium]|nr:type IV secretion system DNA-binding domain-containing protein [Patescibacteria group bacterium]